MDDHEAVESLLQRMAGQVIDEVGIDNDEFFMYLEDGTYITLSSNEELNLYYELADKPH
jgi:hypothetical protein